MQHWGQGQGCNGKPALSHQHCHPTESHSWTWTGLREPRVHPRANTHLLSQACLCVGAKSQLPGATSPGQSPASSQQPKDSSKHKRSWGAAFYFQAFPFPSAVWYYPACSVCSFNKAHVLKNPSQAELSCLALSKGPGCDGNNSLHRVMCLGQEHTCEKDTCLRNKLFQKS